MQLAGIRLTWLAGLGLLTISAPALADGPTDASATRVRVAMRQPPPATDVAPAPAPAPVAAPAPVPAAAVPAAAATATDVAPAPLAPAVVAPVDAEPMIVDYVESPRPVNLEHRRGPDSAWEYACPSPCGIRVPKNQEFRVTGDGIKSSKPLSLAVYDGNEITLNVKPGTPDKYHAGIAVTLVGSAIFVAGGIVLLSQGTTKVADGNTDRYDIIEAGVALLGGGLAVAITGGAITYDNAHSQLSEATPKEGEGQPTHTGFALPSYNETHIPLFSGRF